MRGHAGTALDRHGHIGQGMQNGDAPAMLARRPLPRLSQGACILSA